jgi:hypothetical protein
MKPRNVAQYILAALIVVCFFVLLGILVFKQIPKDNGEVLYLAVGSLLSAFATVTGYFFGSSAGSQAKTEIMAKEQEQKPL